MFASFSFFACVQIKFSACWGNKCTHTHTHCDIMCISIHKLFICIFIYLFIYVCVCVILQENKKECTQRGLRRCKGGVVGVEGHREKKKEKGGTGRCNIFLFVFFF